MNNKKEKVIYARINNNYIGYPVSMKSCMVESSSFEGLKKEMRISILNYLNQMKDNLDKDDVFMYDKVTVEEFLKDDRI